MKSPIWSCGRKIFQAAPAKWVRAAEYHVDFYVVVLARTKSHKVKDSKTLETITGKTKWPALISFIPVRRKQGPRKRFIVEHSRTDGPLLEPDRG